jgi:hypothetical protein
VVISPVSAAVRSTRASDCACAPHRAAKTSRVSGPSRSCSTQPNSITLWNAGEPPDRAHYVPDDARAPGAIVLGYPPS